MTGIKQMDSERANKIVIENDLMPTEFLVIEGYREAISDIKKIIKESLNDSHDEHIALEKILSKLEAMG